MTRLFAILICWWWLGIVSVCFLSLIFSLTSEKLGWLKIEYASTAIIEVRPMIDVDPTASNGSARQGNPELETRAFMTTAFEYPIPSPATLELVLEDENLMSRLGTDKKSALKRMSHMVTSRKNRETGYVEISTKSDDPFLARDLLEAVIAAYEKRRNDLANGLRKEQLKAIQVELKNKSDRVAEFKKRLENMAKLPVLPPSKHDSQNDITIAKREYETSVKIRDAMKYKLEIESRRHYPVSNVIIHQTPDFPTSPASYGPHFRLAFFLLPVSVLLSFILMNYAEKRFPHDLKTIKEDRYQPDF